MKLNGDFLHVRRTRLPRIKLVRWGWYADVPVPFVRVWVVCDVGQNWEIGWRRDR